MIPARCRWGASRRAAFEYGTLVGRHLRARLAQLHADDRQHAFGSLWQARREGWTAALGIILRKWAPDLYSPIRPGCHAAAYRGVLSAMEER